MAEPAPPRDTPPNIPPGALAGSVLVEAPAAAVDPKIPPAGLLAPADAPPNRPPDGAELAAF